jgi:hypothetical protein
MANKYQLYTSTNRFMKEVQAFDYDDAVKLLRPYPGDKICFVQYWQNSLVYRWWCSTSFPIRPYGETQ